MGTTGVESVFLLLLPAWADDDCIIYSAELEVEWVLDAEGEMEGAIAFYSPPEAEGLKYLIESVLVYNGVVVEWLSAPVALPVDEYLEVPVVVPAEAFHDPEQLDYLSDIRVRVALIGSEGQRYYAESAPLARVAFDGADAYPILLDDAMAAELAPGDAWNPAKPARRADVRPEDIGEKFVSPYVVAE